MKKIRDSSVSDSEYALSPDDIRILILVKGAQPITGSDVRNAFGYNWEYKNYGLYFIMLENLGYIESDGNGKYSLTDKGEKALA